MGNGSNGGEQEKIKRSTSIAVQRGRWQVEVTVAQEMEKAKVQGSLWRRGQQGYCDTGGN